MYNTEKNMVCIPCYSEAVTIDKDVSFIPPIVDTWINVILKL